ncbi:MAG: creatininase family protein [Verrucomicrobiaceae bacterium]|nr:creatininase family protein [Verrucomicrobiaceae bacterium]
MSATEGPRHWIIAETNWKHVQSNPYEVAVLPMGATEAHNWHLPYGTDSYQNEYICAEAGRIAWEKGAKVGILPNMPFGVQTGQLDIPFCINMSPSTQMAVIEDVIESLEGVGVPKLVLLNGHGGNDFKQMLRELQSRHPAIFLSTVSWFQIPFPKDIFECPGDHADERETSMMMQLHPGLVLPKSEWGAGTDNPSKLKAIREKWAWAQRAWTKATNDTGSGDPSKSTADKGRRYLEIVTQTFAEYLVELAAVDKDDLYQKA